MNICLHAYPCLGGITGSGSSPLFRFRILSTQSEEPNEMAYPLPPFSFCSWSCSGTYNGATPSSVMDCLKYMKQEHMQVRNDTN